MSHASFVKIKDHARGRGLLYGWRQAGFLLGFQLSSLLCGLSLVATMVVWKSAQQMIQRQAAVKFENEVRETRRAIQSRLEHRMDFLSSVQGLYAANESVARDAFAAFIRGQRLNGRYPGLESVWFIERVPARNLSDFVQQVRSDTRVNPAGYPDFAVHPSGTRDEYFVVKYLEPFDGNEQAMGFDLKTEPVYREALERAQETGKPAATSHLPVLTGQAPHSRLLIAVPVYRHHMPTTTPEERRAALQGCIAGVFDANTLFAHIWPEDLPASQIELDMFDGAVLAFEVFKGTVLPPRELLLYQSNPAKTETAAQHAARLHQVVGLEVAGRSWTLHFMTAPGFGLNPSERYLPLMALLGGVMVSGFSFAMMYFLGTSRDRAVELARQMTDKLRSQRDQLLIRDRAIAAAPDGVIITDPTQPDNPVVYCNPGFERLTGYSRKEVLGRNCRFLQGDDRSQEALKEVRQAIEEQRGCQVVLRNYKKDGSLFWNELLLSPVFNEQGRLVNFVGIQHDMTDRNRAEQALARLASFPEENPNPVIELTRSGAITYLNPAAQSRFPDLEQLGERHPALRGVLAEPASGSPAGKGLRTYEVEVGRRVYDQKITAIPESDAIRIYMIDITERKRLEEQIHQNAAELVRSNTELVRRETVMHSLLEDLQTSKDRLEQQRLALQEANEQMEQANQRLRDAQLQLIQAEKMESVGRLAAGVAHEVKNPLAIILMGVAYLSRQLTDGDGHVTGVLKDIDSAVQRADSVIRGLLDFSAPRDLRLSIGTLDDVIEQSLLLVKHELARSRVNVVNELDRGLPSVRMDRNKLEQVFVNLFMNAIHAMPEGGMLTVRTRAKRLTDVTSDVGSREMERFRVGELVVMADVEDTGCGIPREKLAKVFDPFFTTKPTGKGTGLGLTVTKKIVELHGGTVEIVNRAEGGVRATIMLKAQRSHEAMPSHPIANAIGPRGVAA